MQTSHTDSPEEKDFEKHILKTLGKLTGAGVEVRNRAITELRSFPKGQLLEVLRAWLLNPDPERRCDVAEALMLLAPEEGQQLVTLLLKDPQPFVRRHVCGLLHDFGNADVTEPLVEVLRADEDGNVRHIAAYALGKVGDMRALQALQWARDYDQGTDFEGRTVSEMATEAIESILARY